MSNRKVASAVLAVSVYHKVYIVELWGFIWTFFFLINLFSFQSLPGVTFNSSSFLTALRFLIETTWGICHMQNQNGSLNLYCNMLYTVCITIERPIAAPFLGQIKPTAIWSLKSKIVLICGASRKPAGAWFSGWLKPDVQHTQEGASRAEGRPAWSGREFAHTDQTMGSTWQQHWKR